MQNRKFETHEGCMNKNTIYALDILGGKLNIAFTPSESVEHIGLVHISLLDNEYEMELSPVSISRVRSEISLIISQKLYEIARDGNLPTNPSVQEMCDALKKFNYRPMSIDEEIYPSSLAYCVKVRQREHLFREFADSIASGVYIDLPETTYANLLFPESKHTLKDAIDLELIHRWVFGNNTLELPIKLNRYGFALYSRTSNRLPCNLNLPRFTRKLEVNAAGSISNLPEVIETILAKSGDFKPTRTALNGFKSTMQSRAKATHFSDELLAL